MTRPDDPRVISQLVDRLLGEARKQSTAPKAKPSVQAEAPRATAKKAPPPKPPSTTKNEGESMRLKPKKTPAKHRTPSKPRKGYAIEIAQEALEPSTTWTPAPYVAEKPKVSARDVPEPTPCRICGGAVDQVEGVHSGRWRQHREDCPSLSARSEFRVAPAAAHLGLGIEISDDLAGAVDMFIPTYEGTGASPVYSADHVDRLPWHHVDRKALVKALLIAKGALTEAAKPRECEQGRCCWCGVARALDWRLWGHKWPDGSDAPMCEECSKTYVRRGHPSPSYPADAHLSLVEAITGVGPSMGDEAPALLKAFHEVGQGGSGDERWDYLPAGAVEALRWSLWGRFGGKHAPAEHKAEAVARARAKESDRAAKLTAIEHADPYGFGGGAGPIEREARDDD